MRGVSSLQDLSDWLRHELNFFRVHLLFFVVVPLVSAAIFWGANGEFPVGGSCRGSLSASMPRPIAVLIELQ